MTQAVVTGGAGFIGSHIVDALLERGDEVSVIDDLSNGRRELVDPRAVFYRQDILDWDQLASIFQGAAYVFHLAALPRVQYSIDHPVETHGVNVTGTVAVLEAARRAGVKRVVFSSSSSVYGEPESLPVTETMSVKPQSPYALHKYIGECYCRTWSEIYGLSTVSLRYFNVYGPRQSAEGAYALVIAKFLKQQAAGESLTITGDGRQTRDFIHVSDVARANLLAADAEQLGQGEVINIGSGHNVSVNEIAELVGGQKRYIESRLEPKNTLADNRRAGELLGWQPQITLADGLKQLL